MVLGRYLIVGYLDLEGVWYGACGTRCIYMV